MNYPKCSRNIYCKSGFSQGRQRYKCKGYHYHYTVEHRSGTGTSAIRQQALELYLEGLGFRSIGRILGFSNVSILNWIREFGKKPDALRSEKSVSVVEIDEMHSAIGNKKRTAGSGSLLIEIGTNSSIVLPESGIQKRGRDCGKN